MARKTKTEIAKAEIAARHAALRWSENPPAPDVPTPVYGEPEVFGFLYNLYGMSVSHARCTTSYMAVDEDLAQLRSNPSWQQTRVPMFSTRARALAAMRHAAECEAAAQLERIDRMAAQK